MVGRLDVDSVGSIPRHHWIELADGRCIDLRARMWLRNDPRVPHGIVMAEAAGVGYEGRANRLHADPLVFWALTVTAVDAFQSATFLEAD